MANVLPKEEQRAMWKLFRARLVIALSIVLFGSSLIACGALLPSFLMLHFVAPAGTPSNSSQESASDTAAVLETETLVSRLSALDATTSPSQAIQRVLSLRPPGVSIDQITYTEGTPGQLVISGFSRSPTVLQSYESALQHDPLFSHVVVPIGSFIGNADGSFTVTLSGGF